MVEKMGTVPRGDCPKIYRTKFVESGLSLQNGMVLLTVVIVLLTITLIGGSLALLFSSLAISGRTYADEAKALYLAEAGLSRGLNWLRNEARTQYFSNTIGPVRLGEGTYEVKIDIHECVITSTGEVNDVQKKLQLQYKPL